MDMRIERYDLRIRQGKDFDVISTESDPRYKALWSTYYELTQRKGITLEYAKLEARRRTTLISVLMLKLDQADGVLCGTFGQHRGHLRFIRDVLGMKPGVQSFYTMNLLSLPERTVGLCDTYVNYDPSVEQVVEMTELAAEELCRFGMTPKIALLSHSSFGTDDTPTALKMRKALAMLHEKRPRSGS